MTTDSSWGDYLSADPSAVDSTATGTVGAFDSSATAVTEPVVPMVEPVAEPVLPEPVATMVENDLSGAANAQDWSDWHAASGDDWAASAQDWVDYARENAAAGYTDIANNAMGTAASHATIADANYTVAGDYSSSAGSYLDSAAAEVAPYESAASFDAGAALDTGSGYDAGASFDATE